MVNKKAVFSALSLIGVFNVLLYVLFINPDVLLPNVTYVRTCGAAPVGGLLTTNDTTCLATADVSSNASSSSSATSSPPPSLLSSSTASSTATAEDVKFEQRTLMMSSNGANSGGNNAGENGTDVVNIVSNRSAVDVAATTTTTTTDSMANSDVTTKTTTTATTTIATMSSSVTSTPLKAPPTTTTPTATVAVGRTGRKAAKRKANNGTTTTSVPLTTVGPPPTPRVDPHNYTYIINQPGVCTSYSSSSSSPATNNGEQLLVILVCTSLANVASRDAIRETWGAVARNASSGIRLVFLLGAGGNESLQAAIAAESSAHGDIIQEDFLDTYNNLTLKSVMLLKWVRHHCPAARFVLKTDDDMFIHVRNLVKYVTAVKKRRRMLFGRLVRGARPVRAKTNKWYAPTSVFKERVYPDYLSGTAYAMSADVAKTLYGVALHTPLFHLEDVFVTGMCARKAGIPRRHHSGFTYETRGMSGCAFRNAISGHRIGADNMRKIWREINSANLTCPR